MQNFDWLLAAKAQESVNYFAKHLSNLGFDNVQLIYNVTKARLSDLQKNTNLTLTIPGNVDLEQQWYQALRLGGQPDYSIYDSDFYLAEAFACWIVYSRKYLKEIPQSKYLLPYGVLADMQPVRKLVDLGCGIGYSTGGLKQLLPQAEIVGTNVPGSKQYLVAESVGKVVGFTMRATPEEVGNADAIFASEYFEHFLEPVAHLRAVLEAIQPRTLLIANAFGPNAPGHFDTYFVDGVELNSQDTSRAFGKTLKDYGYEKVKTKFWNNRPNYWRLKK